MKPNYWFIDPLRFTWGGMEEVFLHWTEIICLQSTCNRSLTDHQWLNCLPCLQTVRAPAVNTVHLFWGSRGTDSWSPYLSTWSGATSASLSLFRSSAYTLLLRCVSFSSTTLCSCIHRNTTDSYLNFQLLFLGCNKLFMIMTTLCPFPLLSRPTSQVMTRCLACLWQFWQFLAALPQLPLDSVDK